MNNKIDWIVIISLMAIAIRLLTIVCVTRVIFYDDEKGYPEKYVLLAEFKKVRALPSDTTIIKSDGTFETYKAYDYFDFGKLIPEEGITDSSYVYIHESHNQIIVRLSNDFDCPYILTQTGSFWTCRWESPLLGDSIKFNRFVADGYVYDYFQFLRGDSIIPKLYVSKMLKCSEYFFPAQSNIKDYSNPTFPELLKFRDATFGTIHNKPYPIDSIYQSGVRYREFSLLIDNDKNYPYNNYIILSSYGGCPTLNHKNTPIGIYDINRDLRRPYFLRFYK